MKSTLPQLLVPESAKDSASVAVAGGYAMNNGTGLSASLPYPQGQPYRVPDLRVMIVMEGEGSLLVNLVRSDLRGGDIVVVPAGTIVEPTSISADFKARLISSQTDKVEKPLLVHPEAKDREELGLMTNIIWRALHTEPPALDTARFQFLTFLSKVKYLAGKAPRRKSLRSEEIFQLFIEAVNTFTTQNRRIPFFAEKLGISPHHLSAVVKEASGESAMGWIHKAAIQRAKLLLSQGMTALQVSEALEFSSAPYFNRYFKRLTGMTPGEYQKR